MDTPLWMKHVPMVDKLHSNTLQDDSPPQMHKSDDGVYYYDRAVEHPIMNEIVSQLRTDFPARNVQFFEFCGESKKEFCGTIGLLRASNPKFSVTIASIEPDKRITIIAYCPKVDFKVEPVWTQGRLYNEAKSAIQKNQASIIYY